MSMHVRALSAACKARPASYRRSSSLHNHQLVLQAVCNLLEVLGCHRQMLWLRMCPCAGPDLLPWGAVGTRVLQQLSAQHAQDASAPTAAAGRAAALQNLGRELIAQQAEPGAAAGSATVPSDWGTQKAVRLPMPDLAALLSMPQDAVPCLQCPVRCWQSAAPVYAHGRGGRAASLMHP